MGSSVLAVTIVHPGHDGGGFQLGWEMSSLLQPWLRGPVHLFSATHLHHHRQLNQTQTRAGVSRSRDYTRLIVYLDWFGEQTCSVNLGQCGKRSVVDDRPADSDSPCETSANDTQTWVFPCTSGARTVRLHLTYISRRAINALNLPWPEPDNLRAAQRCASLPSHDRPFQCSHSHLSCRLLSPSHFLQ